ncbi:hypothetical protein [Salipaludibacillus sp. CF4.18]|uniref:hypothetical protein n=1 Tax=Salipaludibacillus sp. CF4.18 TaxID=3373081 RepID=UPI003EE4F2CE
MVLTNKLKYPIYLIDEKCFGSWDFQLCHRYGYQPDVVGLMREERMSMDRTQQDNQIIEWHMAEYRSVKS